MGVGNRANLVYFIDFGLSKEYRDPSTREHIPFDNGVGFTGTTTHPLIVTTVWSLDDLESLAYVLFYFFWGILPWQGLSEEAILESKRTITTHKLFLGLPAELCTFFEHSRSLSFDGKPDYDYFYNLFGDLILREGFHLDMPFDWGVASGKYQRGCTDS